eukprot:TRINITY_DN4787_c0_g1_i1.p1 TRINITY_DN4787_c0_g1~~TRINITY_DN4787_c0_g1_i1.p1  ORF type:complete len:372 (+),score=50.91 TRINITY_DN4787_c0_g1_i1:96-1211(+)
MVSAEELYENARYVSQISMELWTYFLDLIAPLKPACDDFYHAVEPWLLVVWSWLCSLSMSLWNGLLQAMGVFEPVFSFVREFSQAFWLLVAPAVSPTTDPILSVLEPIFISVVTAFKESFYPSVEAVVDVTVQSVKFSDLLLIAVVFYVIYKALGRFLWNVFRMDQYVTETMTLEEIHDAKIKLAAGLKDDDEEEESDLEMEDDGYVRNEEIDDEKAVFMTRGDGCMITDRFGNLWGVVTSRGIVADKNGQFLGCINLRDLEAFDADLQSLGSVSTLPEAHHFVVNDTMTVVSHSLLWTLCGLKLTPLSEGQLGLKWTKWARLERLTVNIGLLLSHGATMKLRKRLYCAFLLHPSCFNFCNTCSFSYFFLH